MNKPKRYLNGKPLTRERLAAHLQVAGQATGDAQTLRLAQTVVELCGALESVLEEDESGN